MEVIFVRYAQAESNLFTVETGVVGSDLGLTAEGARQAASTANYLGTLAARKLIHLPDNIYSSPYIRTRQTADIISRAINRPVEIDYRLKEIQKGDWHGMKVKDVLPFENGVEANHRPYFRPPAGENWFDVAERMTEFINDIEERGETSAIVVSHNHPIEIAIGK